MAVYDINGVRIDDGLSNEAKTALLNSFDNNAWANQNGQTYYDSLREALYANNVNRITAVFTPGTHEVYPTDNIEALRNFLAVTAYYNNGTHEEIYDYTLSGDISSVGVKTITVTYNTTNSSTFDVTVVANTTGLLYEWDFTKGLTDLRQNQLSRLVHSVSQESDAVIDSSGLHFNDFGQALVLLSAEESTGVTFFSNKTIQVDVGSFEPQSESNNNHVRFLMFRKLENGWDSGIVYFGKSSGTNGWNFYAGSNGWGNVSAWGTLSQKTDIANHTVGLYINTSLKPKLYIDSVSKGTQNVAMASNLAGLMLGSNEGITAGANLFKATITGLRIYSGEVAN